MLASHTARCCFVLVTSSARRRAACTLVFALRATLYHLTSRLPVCRVPLTGPCPVHACPLPPSTVLPPSPSLPPSLPRCVRSQARGGATRWARWHDTNRAGVRSRRLHAGLRQLATSRRGSTRLTTTTRLPLHSGPPGPPSHGGEGFPRAGSEPPTARTWLALRRERRCTRIDAMRLPRARRHPLLECLVERALSAAFEPAVRDAMTRGCGGSR